MRIVLDTNVLVSGVLSPYGAPGEIVRMAAADIVHICFDARIISEYHNVLRRSKFKLDKEKVDVLLDQIESCGYLVAAEPALYDLPDKDDEPFLEVAAAGEADYLVTGNIKHYPVKKRQNVQVVTPVDFLQEYRRKKSSNQE